jgi:hypothetical protein
MSVRAPAKWAEGRDVAVGDGILYEWGRGRPRRPPQTRHDPEPDPYDFVVVTKVTHREDGTYITTPFNGFLLPLDEGMWLRKGFQAAAHAAFELSVFYSRRRETRRETAAPQ